MPSNGERLNDILKRTTPVGAPINEQDLLPDEAEPGCNDDCVNGWKIFHHAAGE